MDEAHEEARWVLQPLRVDTLPETMDIDGDGLTIGRDPSSGVVVPKSSYPGVSGHHARIVLEGDALTLEDLDSKNKTLVRGRPVTTHQLKHGDVFQLGPGGPRFAVLSSLGGGDETMEIPRSMVDSKTGPARSIGVETMMIVREKLGIPEGADVQEMVHTKSRRNLVLIGVVTIVIVVGGWFVVQKLTESGQRAVDDLEQKTAELGRRLDEQIELARAQIEEQRTAWSSHRDRLDEAETVWQSQQSNLQDERANLQASLDRLEADDRSAADEISRLTAKLQENAVALDRFDPVKLDMERLDRVGRVEKTVVLIEASVTYRHEETGVVLHVDQTDAGLEPNFEGRGQPVTDEGTGSGFCMAGGWILTNAHVVYRKDDAHRPIEVGPDTRAVPDLELKVVFTETSTRHPARLVRWASAGNDDLALLRIEPFDGMPMLESLDLDVGDPPGGSDVYLIGFPLGKRALQDGDLMTASTFRGIVSRKVGHFLQVDAAVHPGQSGGPAIDAEGRVIGLVTAMQAVDAVAGSSAIGFITPIVAAGKLWPPPE